MVLESLVDPLGAEQKPYRMFFYGVLYSSIAVILSLWIFQSNASLVMVFLTTLACVPLMYNTIKFEEQKDESIIKESSLLKEHGRALLFFIFIFFGVVVSYAFWYIILPPDVASNLFSVQTETIANINAATTGTLGFSIALTSFFKILLNNVKVLLFALLFAFLYGVGAIFILIWNASVIGAAIGSAFKIGIVEIQQAIGSANIISYVGITKDSLLRYSIHGIPEILAYFTAGLAAGIMSFAVMKKKLDFQRFKRILLDSSNLLIIAFLLLVLAAFLEVFVTPVFFR